MKTFRSLPVQLLALVLVGSLVSQAWADPTWGRPAVITTARTINTTPPLTGGGDLSADRTLAISAATSGAAGSMSAADKAKIDAYPNSSTDNTIVRFNGTGGGTQTSGVVIDDSDRLGLGTSAPTHSLTLSSTATGLTAYNTADQVTNYERLLGSWSGNVYTLRTEQAGSGTVRNFILGSGTAALLTLNGASGSAVLAGGQATGAGPQVTLTNGVPMTSTSAVQNVAAITGTVNQSSTAGYTGLRINITETGTGSGTKSLLSAETGGTVRFAVSNVGTVTSTGSTQARSTTAIPAGGISGYTFSTTSNFGIYFGSGAPTVSASKGSLYLRSDGSTTNDRMYVNTDGGTTWTPVTTGS